MVVKEKTRVEKIIDVTSVYDRTVASRAKTIVNVGGAGSSKSHSLAQEMIEKLTQEAGKTIGICRKTFPALRMTAMKLVLDMIKDYGFYDPNRHNKTANTYSYNPRDIETSKPRWPRDSVIQFFSMDEWLKIKSADFNYIWMEEGNEFTYADYTAFKLCLRSPTKPDEPNQIFVSLNPSDAQGWIPTKLANEPDVEFIHSTFQDNRFLSKEYIKTITDLIDQDANFYKIYALGEWGLLQRRIYTNYKVIPELPDMSEAKWGYGLDWGLVNPSALLKAYLLNGQWYLEERLYKSGLTNSDIIEHLSHEEKGDIWGDPTEKQMIEEIYRAGYNIYEAHKDVRAGIDLCQRQTLNIPESSVNLIKEVQSYQWKEDKNGNVIPEPIKFNDHLVDDIRYVIFGMTEKYGFATAKPGGQGYRTTIPRRRVLARR